MVYSFMFVKLLNLRIKRTGFTGPLRTSFFTSMIWIQSHYLETQLSVMIRKKQTAEKDATVCEKPIYTQKSKCFICLFTVLCRKGHLVENLQSQQTTIKTLYYL